MGNYCNTQRDEETRLIFNRENAPGIGIKCQYFPYFLTGQYVCPKTENTKKSVIMVIYFIIVSFLISFSLNLFPFIATLVDWTMCYSKYFNVCYSILLHPTEGTTAIPDIVLRSVSNDSNSLYLARNQLSMFTTYAKLVLLVTSFSSAISYVTFFLAFMHLYFFPHFKKVFKKECCICICILWCINKLSNLLDYLHFGKRNDDDDVTPLHPFDDSNYKDKDKSISTQLERRQAISLYSMLAVNSLINISMFGVFMHYQYRTNNYDQVDNQSDYKNNLKNTNILEMVAVVIYMYSLFTTLFSCYIFSKLAYGVQNRYMNFEVYLKNIDVDFTKESDKKAKVINYLDIVTKKYGNSWSIEGLYEEGCKTKDYSVLKLYYLQEKDKHDTKIARKTIKVFELWFFFHWILYIISSFLSLSLFFEAVVYCINSRVPDPDNFSSKGINFHDPQLAFLGLFSASNCLFFLYPCVRAASVTNSRQNQIRKLNQEYSSEYAHITTELKDQFASFLASQNAGFDLHILCARVSFGFSVAYISIFIALFSVLLKVARSV